MKSVIAICLFALASVAYARLQNSDIVKAVNECKKANNCRENLLAMMRNKQIPATPEGLKSMYCAAEKLGVVSADGKVNEEKMTEIFKKMYKNDQIAADLTSKCKDSIVGVDDAAKAKSMMTCVQTNAPGKN